MEMKLDKADWMLIAVLSFLCCFYLSGCGGMHLVPTPAPGCRTIITSEASGAQFAEEAANQYVNPGKRALRIIRRDSD
jgi:hypothetical protein